MRSSTSTQTPQEGLNELSKAVLELDTRLATVDASMKLVARVDDPEVIGHYYLATGPWHKALAQRHIVHQALVAALQKAEVLALAERWRLAYIKQLEGELDALREALEQADKEASTAHDAIWRKEVQSNLWLHDNDEPLSAQSAIWRLHEVARAALTRTEERTP